MWHSSSFYYLSYFPAASYMLVLTISFTFFELYILFISMKFSFHILCNKISIPFACDSNLVFLRIMHLASRDVLMSYGDILVLDSLWFHIIINMFVMENTTGSSISLDSPGSSVYRMTLGPSRMSCLQSQLSLSGI